MAARDKQGGGRPRRASSIRAAAESAAGSASPPAPKPKPKGRGGAATGPRSPASTPRGGRTPLSTPRTARPARRREAAGPSSGPTSIPVGDAAPGLSTRELEAGSWDPWGERGDEAAANGAASPGPERPVPGEPGAPAFDPQRTLGEWFQDVIPPDAQAHFANAGREFALGVQTTVEHHRGKVRGADEGSSGPSRIEIE